MKNEQPSKMNFMIAKALLIFGFLFTVINLYSQDEDLGADLRQIMFHEEDPFTLKRDPSSQDTILLQAEAQEEVTTAIPLAATSTTIVPSRSSLKGDYCKHELSVWGAGGLSSLYYDPTFGDHSPKLGGAFGLGYTHYFNPYFGILTGAELALYNTTMKIDGSIDGYDIKNYEETQRMTNVNIPLIFQLQTGGKHKFYAGLGFKIGIPVSGEYKVSDGRFDLDNDAFTASDIKDDISFRVSYMGTVEAGVKWRLNRTLSLYTGAYLDYGFNDVIDTRNDQFIAYNTNPQINSTLTSEYTRNGKTEAFASHVSPLAVGLKIRLGVNLCSGKDTKIKELVEESQQQSKKSKARTLITAREQDEEENVIAPEESAEDLRKFVFKYEGGIKGTITIELEGYELDQSTLSPKMGRVLDEKIAEIKQTYGDDVRIVCEGHTCSLGKVDYNMSLGLKRANTVRNYLIKKGYSANRVEATSMGPKSPIAPNDTEANRKKNRRVVLVIKDL